MSPELFVSRAKALPAKGSEKGYVDENDTYPAVFPAVSTSSPGAVFFPPLETGREESGNEVALFYKYCI